VLGRLHAPPEEPPSWATFDDEAPVDSSGESGVDAPSAETGPPADIPISTPADEPPAPVKSAAKQPRARKTTTAATKTAKSTAKSSAAKPVRAPRQAKPSAFDRTED